MSNVNFSDEPATLSRGGYLTRPPGLVELFYSIIHQGISVLAEDGEKIVGISTHFIFQRGFVDPPRTFQGITH